MQDGSLQHAKMVCANDKMYNNSQMKAEYIYIYIYIYRALIYMYERLGLGFYGPYICMYTNLEACARRGADTYIRIYIYLNLGAQG